MNASDNYWASCEHCITRAVICAGIGAVVPGRIGTILWMALGGFWFWQSWRMYKRSMA